MLRMVVVLVVVFSNIAFAQPIRVVITGGPGVGKSSIISELEVRGEAVLREAATDLIALLNAKGLHEPWEAENFQNNITLFQERREDTVGSDLELVFQDRSLIDSFGYYEFRKQTIPANLDTKLKQMKLEGKYYEYVFFIKNLGQSFLNEIRKHDLEDSMNIEYHLREAYRSRGYKIVDIEQGSVDHRVDQIQKFLKDRLVPVSKRGPIQFM